MASSPVASAGVAAVQRWRRGDAFGATIVFGNRRTVMLQVDRRLNMASVVVHTDVPAGADELAAVAEVLGRIREAFPGPEQGELGL